MKHLSFSFFGIFSLLFLFTNITLGAENLENHSFSEAIDYVYEQNIVDGYSDGTYRPDNTINRAEFTKIIISAVYEKNEIENCKISNNTFSDVSPSDWFAPYICVAIEEGIINGYSDKTFRPAKNINFVESAKIIDIAFDGEEVISSPWYDAYVQNLGDFGVIPQSISSLEKNITRGEMAEIIWRWNEEITSKPFMGYEDGKLVSLNPGEVIFGVFAEDESECEAGEFFDTQYQLCILENDDQVQQNIDSVIGSEDNTPGFQPHTHYQEPKTTQEKGVLVHYKIQNNTLVPHAQGSDVNNAEVVTNLALHKKIWEMFYALIPSHPSKDRITQFVLFENTPEESGTLGYVHQVDGKPEEWVLGINYEANFNADGTLKNKSDFYYTLLHEFAHILTLNENNTNGIVDDCPTYEVETGCLKKESIMGNIVENFWKKSPHWSGFDVNDQDAGHDRYHETPNRYVSDYAATNPGEDIAEVFTHFVLYKKPTGTEVKDQKILTLYQYPEMVSFRNAIRSSLGKTSDAPVRKRSSK